MKRSPHMLRLRRAGKGGSACRGPLPRLAKEPQARQTDIRPSSAESPNNRAQVELLRRKRTVKEGYATAPMPQAKFNMLSAATRRPGFTSATHKLVVAITAPSPIP